MAMPMSTLRMLVCGAVLLLAPASHAQTPSASDTYPSRPIKVIVPFAPGGVTDTIARLWAQRMSLALGQQLYVENHGGGGSNLGTGLAAHQPADGYTILVAASSFAVNPSLYARIPYDPLKDFTAVTLLAATPNVVVVHPSVPAKTIGELIALVRANPGKYSYAMSGIGTPNHLQAELLKLAFGLDLVTVPFAGGAPAIQSTVAGHTPIAFVALTSIPALVEGGQLRALAISGTKRSSVLPDVPTMAEAGVSGHEADTFTGIFVPAGTPKTIVDRLYAETANVLAMPEFKQQLAKLGAEPAGTSPEQFAARLKDEIALWGKAIADAHIEKQ
jgi:tripartite-type tricarboxylate transporter receptor subunit TctC